jgi:hypothetical protein
MGNRPGESWMERRGICRGIAGTYRLLMFQFPSGDSRDFAFPHSTFSENWTPFPSTLRKRNLSSKWRLAVYPLEGSVWSSLTVGKGYCSTRPGFRPSGAAPLNP